MSVKEYPGIYGGLTGYQLTMPRYRPAHRQRWGDCWVVMLSQIPTVRAKTSRP
jgi:hypothetical protein